MSPVKMLVCIALGQLFFLPLAAQSGSAGSPFTRLGHAWYVPSSGIYHFSIDGTPFSTYVEAGSGWILIASGQGSTTESSYAITSDLTLQSDAILPAAAYASTDINAVRINVSAGITYPFDVETSDADVIANLHRDTTLSADAESAVWSGTGDFRMGPTCGSSENALYQSIYHAGCIGNGLHWMAGGDWENADYSTGSSDQDDLNLWIRASAVEPLPVGWSFVRAEASGAGAVRVSWETYFEQNNDYFAVERSEDGALWQEIAQVRSQGNSAEPLAYRITDLPFSIGRLYYRVRQTDFDGAVSISPRVEVYLDPAQLPMALELYPNPVKERSELKLDIILRRGTEARLEVFNAQGLRVLSQAVEGVAGTQTLKLPTRQWAAGVYHVRLSAAGQSASASVVIE